jgi:UDP-N-acetylglucosamine 1-carboxyvinyltransferase
MGTENAMLAATLAEGHTIIRPAAQEPEVDDLIEFLCKMGAEVVRTAPDTIEVDGRKRLRGAGHSVIPDRIETGTFLIAAAATGGEITVEAAEPSHLTALLETLQRCGAQIEARPGVIRLRTNGALRAADVTTLPYPEFPTDLQAQFLAMATGAQGVSSITETVFENRFMHVAELRRMGARIEVSGRTAKVTGPTALSGAPVMASDLRASASLIVAGLRARGETLIHRAYHIDRGYERVERKFQALGARIERLRD